MLRKLILLTMGFAFAVTSAQDRPIGFASLEGEGNKYVQGGTTGGAGGTVVTVTNAADLERYVTANEPYIIQIRGTITISPKGKELSVKSNKTVIGLGNDAYIKQGGFFLGSGVKNVIFRNFHIGETYKADDPDGKDQDWDGIQMDGAHHVWIDHCRFYRIGDGMIDSRKNTDFITVSWSIFEDHNKVFGIGWTEDLISKLTIHHNIFRRLHQRNPSCDNAYCHMFNNYLEDITSYGHSARKRADMMLENSIFVNVANPYNYEPDAKLTARNVVTTNSSGNKRANGKGFDPTRYYSYALDPTDGLKKLLEDNAGPQSWVGTGTVPDIKDCANVSGGTAKMDACGICIPEGSSQQACTGSIQAEEHCEPITIPVETENAGYTGVGYVNTENKKGAKVSWVLNSPQEQSIWFSLSYANGGATARSADVVLNQQTIDTLGQVNTSGWDKWRFESILLNLRPGTNEIGLIAQTDDGLANLDVIHFSGNVSDAQCNNATVKITSKMSSPVMKFTLHDGFVYLSKSTSWSLTNLMGKRVLVGVGDKVRLSGMNLGVYYLEAEGHYFKVAWQ